MRRFEASALLLLVAFAAAPAVGDPLVFDAEQRDRMALATAPLAPGADDGAVDASGRVLDPQPLIDAALARGIANSVAERSGRELLRVRRLNRGAENASARELEAAEDADRQARIGAEAAEARFSGAWGQQLAGRPDIGVLVTALRRGRVALARVDLPAGVDTLAGPTGLRVSVATRPERALDAKLIGPAPSIDPVLQGNGWFVLIQAPPPVGTALVATLDFADRRFEGVVIPRAAVVRQDGRAFVYVEAPPGSFERHAVSLLSPREGGWLATGPLVAGDQVVVRGAQQLLAAERAPHEAH